MRWIVLFLVGCSTHKGADGGTDPAQPSGPPPCDGKCSAAQFCNGSTCADAVLANACLVPEATVVLDGQDADDKAARNLGSAMLACNPSMMVRYVPASDAKGVFGADGRPVLGPNNLLVTAGGGFAQPTVRFMEGALTPIFSQSTSGGLRMQVIERSNGNPLVDVANSALTPTHDAFVIQLAAHPASGTFSLIAYGLYAPGTTAAVWYLQNVMLPKKETYGDRWWVFDWNDTDAMPGPSAGDTFTKVGSGK